MSLRTALPACLALLAAGCGASPPVPEPAEAVRDLSTAVRAAITADGLRAQAEAIARHDRTSGRAGEIMATDHILATLQAGGVPMEVYTIPAYTSDPVRASVEILETGLRPEAITLPFSGNARDLEAEIVDVAPLKLPGLEPGTGENLVPAGLATTEPAERPELPDLTGRIALVDGQPRNAMVTVLAGLGAAGAIFVDPEDRLHDRIMTSTRATPSLRSYHRLHGLPVVQIRRRDGEAIRRQLAGGTVHVRISAEVRTGWEPLRLAVARIAAPVPDAPYVLFGGHIDAWRPGEGASGAAMVELARALHRNRHLLRRGIVIAWWPGHGNARYAGSTWFADQFFDELRRRAVAHVDIDGIGQAGAQAFGAATTASLAELARDVVARAQGVEIEPGRPGRGSDQSFNGIGLPLLQLYHHRIEEDDTFDRIDFNVLETDTGLYADAIAALLAAPVLPVDLGAEVEALGAAIERRAAQANGRLGLEEAMQRQKRLHHTVHEVQAMLPDDTDAAVDLTLVRILRPLHRVLYAPLGPYHPDPGVEGDLLPGLSAATILGEADATSGRYRLAETTLLRERNRLLEALDEATREAEMLRDRLADVRPPDRVAGTGTAR